MKKKIVVVHLLNDYSGSPRVLATAITGFQKAGWQIDLYTSKGPGFLSACDGCCLWQMPYRFHENKWMRLWALLRVQLWLFVRLVGRYRHYSNSDVVFYLNTLMPFGAALAGKILGKRVVYHIHETSVRPPVLKRWLRFVARHTAHHAIFVSRFLQKQEALKGVPSSVVYNALSEDFIRQAEQYQQVSDMRRPFTVLMLCSLKDYKGVAEFVALAARLPQFQFELVLNATMEEIRQWFALRQIEITDNLIVFPAQRNVHPFYQRAHLVLNLSYPERWIETFGMTLLEAMWYGKPVIAPPVGGPTELVQHGQNGLLIQPKDIAQLAHAIELLAKDQSLYTHMAAQARISAQKFSIVHMKQKIVETVGEVPTQLLERHGRKRFSASDRSGSTHTHSFLINRPE